MEMQITNIPLESPSFLKNFQIKNIKNIHKPITSSLLYVYEAQIYLIISFTKYSIK